MPRVKRGVTAHARHKKVLDLAKGFRGRRKNVFRIAKQAVMKAGQSAYHGIKYSVFMNGLKKANIEIDRKMLADIAVMDKAAFAKIAGQVKASLAA